MSNNRQRTQETLASLSAGIEPEQREWMDAEILRRSTPGDMWNISRLIRFLIDFYRASDEYASEASSEASAAFLCPNPSGQPVEPSASCIRGISGSGPVLPGAAAPLDVPPSPVHPAGVVGERAS